MNRRLCILGLSTYLACATTALSQKSAVSENIVHQPNVLLKNICIGLDTSNLRSEWKTPTIETSSTFNTQAGTHRIVFDGGNELQITEQLGDANICKGSAMSDARWKGDKHAQFLPKVLGSRQICKIGLDIKSTAEINVREIAPSLYAIGSCKIGEAAPEKRAGLFYGEILKVDAVPMLNRR